MAAASASASTAEGGEALLKTNRSGVPSPTGPWIVAVLPIVSDRLPHLIRMEKASPESLHSLAEDGMKAKQQAEAQKKPAPAWTSKLPISDGVMQFRMMYRNVRKTRTLSEDQKERAKRGRAGDGTFSLQEQPAGCLVNENQEGLTRLIRLILKEFGSNRQFADWHSIRRQLTPEYWTNLGRGGNAHDDHSQTFIELRPGSFERHRHELCGSSRPDWSERIERAIATWVQQFPHLATAAAAAAAAAAGGLRVYNHHPLICKRTNRGRQ
eukprot:COSAG05_NODE_102_length_19076_cov_21.766612_9_plen_268_part_00